MKDYLFDTSALVKYHHVEAGRQAVVDIVNHLEHRSFISRLSIVEWHSVFVRMIRSGDLTASDFQTLRPRFYTDLRIRKFRVVAMATHHWHRAVRLLSTHGQNHRLRTLDALQLAVALDLHARNRLDAFVCADTALCDVFRLEGISVTNPIDT